MRREPPAFEFEGEVTLVRFGLGNCCIMKGFDGSFQTSCKRNIVPEIFDSTMEEPRLEGVFHVYEI